ncbi:MAG: toll/interleukin-1 receptor domain-containing protein [Terricaulis sp.]
MEVLSPIFGYIELLASFAATLFALRSTRFWVCFPLGLLGVVLLFDAAFRSLGYVDPNDPINAIPGALGVGLLVIGLLGRKRAIGPPLALLGVHLLLFSAAVLSFQNQVLSSTVLLGTGLVLLLLAAISPRMPWGPLLAVLGWFAACSPQSGLGRLLFDPLIDTDGVVFFGGLTTVLVSFWALLWLAPKRAWARMGLYAILVIAGALIYRVLDNLYGLHFLTAFAHGGSLYGLAVTLGAGTLMALLRGWLFGKQLAEGDAEATPVRPTQAAARQPTAQQRPVAPQAPHTPADIFISYKREERARVEAIAKALRELRLSVWFDARLQSGNSFDNEINREVRAAKCVLVCWSPGAVASEWVRAEASIGRQRGVLAACFLDQCDLYPPFNLVHAEDLSHGALDGANPAWAKIVEQIGHLVGRPGLGAYVSAQNERSALGAWLADHASDPLADVALARLRQN